MTTANIPSEEPQGAVAPARVAQPFSAGLDSVQIVKGGEVAEDELAALVAGIVAASAAGGEEDITGSAPTRWVQGARRRHSFPRNGKDSWRWSLR